MKVGSTGRPCQVLRCTREADSVFQIRPAGDVIETVVCSEHDEELSASTGWFYDSELHRIRAGADAPARPTGMRILHVQDGAEVFTLSYERGGESQELELFLTREERHGLIRALRGTVVDEGD